LEKIECQGARSCLPTGPIERLWTENQIACNNHNIRQQAFQPARNSLSLFAWRRSMTRLAVSTLLFLCCAGSALATSDDDQQRLRLLDQKCEDARAAKLAPIRAQMARQCEQERRYSADPRQECELEMSTYGNTFSGPRGAAIRGQYYDLPECVAASAAWKEWEASRPWKN